MSIRYRAADLYRQLPSLSRPDLGCWLAQLQIYSAGTIEGVGLSTTLDRRASEYELSVYCHGYPEALEAAYAWLDGLELITDADLQFMQEVADNIDLALAQDASNWEADDEVVMLEAGVTATQLDAARLEAAPGLQASFAGGFANVRVLDVDHDLLRMDHEDVAELLVRLEAFADQRVQVMVHRVLGYSVPVWVGVLGQDGRCAADLVLAVKAEWERLQRFNEAVYGERA